MKDSTSREPDLSFTHSPWRGDFSRRALAQSCAVALPTMRVAAIANINHFFMSFSSFLFGVCRGALREAIQIFVPAQKYFMADNRRRGVEAVVEFVGGEDLQLLGILDHHRHAAARDQVNAAGCPHGRGVESLEVFDPLHVHEQATGFDIHAGEKSAVIREEEEM